MIYRFDPFQVDDADLRLTANGKQVPLEPRPFRLLLYLIQNSNRLVRKQEILDIVWQEAAVSDAVLTRSIGLVRKALGDDSRAPRYIETVPTAGYRFIAGVSVVDPPPPAGVLAAAPAPVVAPALPKPEAQPLSKINPQHGLSRLRVAVLAGCLILLVTVAGALVERRLHAERSIRSLAVLPLQNLSGDASQDYFAAGMTDEITTDLARIQDLRVVSRTSVTLARDRDQSLQQIASDLNVDAVVEGSIVRSGDRVRITAQLIDTRTDKHLWAQSFEGRADDILALQDSVASQIAAQTRFTLLPAAETRQNPAAAIDSSAHDDYLRGRYFFQKQDLSRSVAYFQQAIAADPSYAAAYAGLADALDAEATMSAAGPQQTIPRALAAATRAIQLDPKNGEAYTALGSIQTIFEWKWPEAEQNLTRGIALSPSYSLGEMKYAVYLDAVGRPEDAVSHMRQALTLDPLSFFMNRRLGATLYLARHYDEALKQLARAGEMEPQMHGSVDNYISLAYEAKGMRDEAVAHDLLALRSNQPQVDTSSLDSTYRRNGWTAYWRARIEALSRYREEYCASYEDGVSYLRLGDRDRALASLGRAVDQQCYRVAWMKVDPELDSIRTDSRYIGLLQRVNLATP
jgi:TolB-like protein/DNA-binding winged helix-turn-helix (wHTH) protein/Tfp pilus assembly protein PilF